MIELTRLRAFCMVADQQSYTRAAEALLMSQPRVHTLVRDLERALGVKLIEQAGKTSHLTEAGRVLYDYGANILRSIGDAEVALGQVKRKERGSLYIGVTEATPTSELFVVIADLKDRYPSIEIQIRSERREALEQALLHREVDVAILLDGSEVPGITRTPWLAEELVLALPPRTSGPLRLTRRTLARLSFVHYLAGCELYDPSTQWLNALGGEPQAALYCHSPWAALSAVEQGIGPALLPHHIAQSGGMRAVEPDLQVPRIEYVAAVLEDRDLPPSAVALAAALGASTSAARARLRNEQ